MVRELASTSEPELFQKQRTQHEKCGISFLLGESLESLSFLKIIRIILAFVLRVMLSEIITPSVSWLARPLSQNIAEADGIRQSPPRASIPADTASSGRAATTSRVAGMRGWAVDGGKIAARWMMRCIGSS